MRIAIIGAGPAGIAAAKFLADEGLHPVIYEQSALAGGQWHTENTHSGIWPGMPTNTSRVMTQFSDLDHFPGTPAFPLVEQIHEYLMRYIKTFKLERYLRLNCQVTELSSPASGLWKLSYMDADGAQQQQEFDQVIVASGRFRRPFIPKIPGLAATGQSSTQSPSTQSSSAQSSSVQSLEQPTTSIRVIHSCEYNGAQDFHGKRVLVAGGAISALEIACDLAMNGAQSVSSCYRSQRYVLGKMASGIPTDHMNFSLYEALAAEILSPEQTAVAMKEFVLATVGNPADYGAFEPHEDLRIAGATKCDHFLPLVKDGKIAVRPWIRNISGHTVEFEDGSQMHIDVLICGTGYRLDIPFLDAAVTETLALDEEHIALFKHTFHPELAGLSVLGFYNQVGPYFPALELHARWIAAVIGGRIPLPDRIEMQAGLQEFFQSWDAPQKMPMHKLALLFSRALGACPDPADWPELQRSLIFGPLSASIFRLCGPGKLEDAAGKVRDDAQAFAMIVDENLTSKEKHKLAAIDLAITHGGCK